VESVTCVGDCTYIHVSLYMTTLIENIMWYSQYMEWTTLNISTISDTAYCLHTFIFPYEVSYILYYFTTDIINIIKYPTDEWLTTSTFLTIHAWSANHQSQTFTEDLILI
jgi:hypothetical protein